MAHYLANNESNLKIKRLVRKDLFNGVNYNSVSIYFINSNTDNINPLNYQMINEYLINGFFPFEDHLGMRHYAVHDLSAINIIEKSIDHQSKIYLLGYQDFKNILYREFSKANTTWAISQLESLRSQSSAKHINYSLIMNIFLLLFCGLLICFPLTFFIFNNCIYLTQTLLKIFLFKATIYHNRYYLKSQHTSINQVPIYSILIPLYDEASKAECIINSIMSLDYPKDKLDVKLIIEASDILTFKAIVNSDMPPYMEIIKVPYSLPKTKPKALNYAMTYVVGEFVAIYDAEDKPDSNQLLKALKAFYSASEDYVCVQAKLNFYNAKSTLLTMFFSMEYSVWFDYLIEGLSILNLPITLGGTSNHFKVKALKKVGYWDPHNVTEDADLGIRLYMHGYKVKLIDSITLEESPTSIATWLYQRSRWIKGFIQTLLIFIKTKNKHNNLCFLHRMVIYIFIGCSTYSFFCLPWLLVAFIYKVDKYLWYIWIINGLLGVGYLYIVGFYAFFRQEHHRNKLTIQSVLALIFWPMYFILHSIASYKALFEIIRDPFKWNKTPHGKNIL